MNYSEVLEKLTSRTFFNSFAGLSRMRKELAYFGNPEEKLSVIHVAGTNGKGSVCAMLASILREAGYRVGLFTSPFIEDFRERIQVNGEMISKYDLTVLSEKVFSYTDTMEEAPNQFEVTTLIALLYFLERNCDLVILETGLGGTYDPTNVIPKPLMSIITNIGLDHSAILGNTIPEIALAKAGIIKAGVPVISYPSCGEALGVITNQALSVNAPLTVVDSSDVRRGHFSEGMEHFTYQGVNLSVALPGEHQRYNGAVVYEAIRLLNRLGYYITDSDIQNGFQSVLWPARMELLSSNPIVYLDGGHNPQCMDAVLRFLQSTYSNKNIIFGVSILQDKDYETMLQALTKATNQVYFIKSNHPRAIKEDILPELCERYHMTLFEDGEHFLNELLPKLTSKDVLCLTGSLFLAGDYRKYFRKRGE